MWDWVCLGGGGVEVGGRGGSEGLRVEYDFINRNLVRFDLTSNIGTC